MDITISKMMKSADRAPVLPSSKVVAIAAGSSATIPAIIIKEIPFPTPRAVICSPNHMRKMVPPTRVITVIKRKVRPGSITAEPWLPVIPSKPTAIPSP